MRTVEAVIKWKPLVVAKDERRAWIVVRGVWRALTYSQADRRMIEETITLLWRRGYFFDAINSGVRSPSAD